jgi:hypothetical protein
MAEDLKTIEGEAVHWAWRVAAVILVVLLISGITGYIIERSGREKAKQDEAKIAQLQSQVDQSQALQKQKDDDAAKAKADGDAQIQQVRTQDQATVATLLKQIDIIKAARPTNVAYTPLENTQGQALDAFQQKDTHLESAVTDYQHAFDAKAAAEKACEDASVLKDQQIANYKDEIKHIPTARPWTMGALFGSTIQTEAQRQTVYGAYLGRSFGFVHVQGEVIRFTPSNETVALVGVGLALK